MNTEIYMGEDTEDVELRQIWTQLHANCVDFNYAVVILKATSDNESDIAEYARVVGNFWIINNRKIFQLESRRLGIKSNDLVSGGEVVSSKIWKQTPTEVVVGLMYKPVWADNITENTTYGPNARLQLVLNKVNYESNTWQGDFYLPSGKIKTNTITADGTDDYVYFERESESSRYCTIKPFNITLSSPNNPLVLAMIARYKTFEDCICDASTIDILNKQRVKTLNTNKTRSDTFTHSRNWLISYLESSYLADYPKWIVPLEVIFYHQYDNKYTKHKVRDDLKFEVDWALNIRINFKGEAPHYWWYSGPTYLNGNINIIIKHGQPTPSSSRWYITLASGFTLRDFYYEPSVPRTSRSVFYTTYTTDRIKVGVGWMDAEIYTNSSRLYVDYWWNVTPLITHFQNLYMYIEDWDGNNRLITPIQIQSDISLYCAVSKLQEIQLVHEICGTLDRPILTMFRESEDLDVTYINSADNNRLKASIYNANSDIAKLTPDLRDIVGKDIWDTKKVSLFCLYDQPEGEYPQGEVLDVYVAGRAILPPPEYMAENCKANALVNSDVAVIPQMLAVKNATYCLPIINGHNILYNYNGVTNEYHISTPIKPTSDIPMPYVCTLVNFDYNAIRNYAFLSNQQTQTPKKITLQTECPDIAELIFTLPAEEGIFVATNDNIHTQLYMECIDNYFDRNKRL